MRYTHGFLLAATLAALAPLPVLAADQPASQQPADGSRIVCKSQPTTGTRLRTKVCHSIAEWELISEENRRTAKEMVGPVVNGARGN
ncbi:hypothetical protein [Rhizorhabdus dicambivorans]|uniref:Uncharacterized protein n=1 Tax=Rhizorhabdus dicambivorans TaxID=1850238 RepID=A0A2A4FZL0_9SPHN|nr:hypothetical protein [Rhizorhabdus dicambivorans]ATE63437.1 hypothetical protein CMV14_02665 [Rhizorhabdus dicambivorans]PCE43656.1 hypothetical protein COO09_04985 [Rhizorhabdus dicambivorans]